MFRRPFIHWAAALLGLFSMAAIPAATASPNGPLGIAMSPDGARLYVLRVTIQSSRLRSEVLAVDTATLHMIGKLELSPRTLPYGLAISPDGSRLYLGEHGSVTVLNSSDFTQIGSAPAGMSPISMAASRDGRRLYVADLSPRPVDPNQPAVPPAGLAVIDGAHPRLMATLQGAPQSRLAGLSRDGRRLYVIDQPRPDDSGRSPSRLQVIDTRRRRVISTTAFDLQLEGGALSPDGRRLYLTATPTKGWGSSIQVYDTRENRVVSEVKIDFGYYAFAMQPVVSPDGQRVFMTMVNDDGAVRVLDTQTLRMTDAVKPPGGATFIAFSPDGKRLYCVGGYGDQARVSTVDTTTLKPMASALLDAMTARLP